MGGSGDDLELPESFVGDGGVYGRFIDAADSAGDLEWADLV